MKEVLGWFTDFQANTDYLLGNGLLAGFLVATAIAVIFSIIALARSSKPWAFFAFLFYGLAAAAYLVNVNIISVIKSFSMDNLLVIVISALAVLAALFAFIGMIRTYNKTKGKKVAEPKQAAVAEAPKQAVAPVPV